MKQGFDAGDFVKRVGERLVGQFADARHATSPSTVGAAMEAPVRDQLGKILPQGIAVGSGFVIDSYGGTSRQSDVVLYERDIWLSALIMEVAFPTGAGLTRLFAGRTKEYHL